MARNTRTFSDVDFNFTANPIALDRKVGTGTITYSTTSTTVTGTGTSFTSNLLVDSNIYFGTTYVGKVKTIASNTSLTLYKAPSASGTNRAFNFGNPADIVRKFDEEAIKASIKNLVLTQNYERPFHSEIGSQIRGLLFEPATPMLGTLMERAIRDTILAFEPRVDLNEVNVQVLADSNEVQARIVFTIINTTRPVTVDLILTRTR